MNSRIALVLLVLLSLSGLVRAEAAAEAEGAAAARKVAYLNVFPSLVGNYDGGGRVRYYKADIALKVEGEGRMERVRHHLPLIRNQLVMLFKHQKAEDLVSLQGKEALRQDALKALQILLEDEEGDVLVEDLLFNNLVIQ